MGRAFVAASLVGALGSVFVASSSGDRGDASWPTLGVAIGRVRAPEYERAIDELEHPERFKDDPAFRYDPKDPDDAPGRKLVERREQVLAKFTKQAHDEGDALIRAAVEVLLHDENAEDRRRAQLLLAQFPRLPRWATVKLEGCETFDAWALAQLARRANGDLLLDQLRTDPANSYWSIYPPPAKVLERELAARIALSDEELAKCSDEYRDSYREVAPSRLEHLAEIVSKCPGEERDFDGDGDPEAIVTCNFWKGSEAGWLDRMGFVALLDRDRVDAPWRVAVFERLDQGEEVEDVVVRDFDRDGVAEAFVRSRGHGGRAGYWVSHMIGLHTTSPLPSLGRTTLLERSIEEPTRFVECRLHVDAGWGGWSEGVGALADERRCSVWKDGAFVESDLVYSARDR
jgi:hypothetical protein